MGIVHCVFTKLLFGQNPVSSVHPFLLRFPILVHMSQPNFAYSTSDYMSEPCTKPLTLVLQDLIICHNAARSSSLHASLTHHLLNISLEKLLAHSNRCTSSTRPGGGPHGAQLLWLGFSCSSQRCPTWLRHVTWKFWLIALIINFLRQSFSSVSYKQTVEER
jgi:hypothetical protein